MSKTVTMRYVLFSKSKGYYADQQPTYQRCYTDDLDRARQYITQQGTLETKGYLPSDTVLRKVTITLEEEEVDMSVAFAKERDEYETLTAEADRVGLDGMDRKKFKRMRTIERMFDWKRYQPPSTDVDDKESSQDVRARILANWQKKLDDDAA
jgi:hypothetical protein